MQLTGRMGVMLQRGGVYPMLGPRRVLDLFARYYPDPLGSDALLDLVGLRSVATTPWRHLSGGEQQRLSLALALIGRPQVAFLDEPTAGVDPEGRLAIRAVVADLRRQGVCVLLTTHELAEAEKMADRIAILSSGRVVLEGTPQALTAARGTVGLTFGAPAGLDTASLAQALGPGARVTERAPGRYDGRGRVRSGGHGRPGHLAGGTPCHHDRPGDRADAGGRVLRSGGLGGLGGRRIPRSPRIRCRRSGPDTGPTTSGGAGSPTCTWRRAVRALLAQTEAEVYMTLRRGETLLLTVGIPVVFLVFFSTVHVVATPHQEAVDFFVPGILALAVMSTAMVSLGIATGFERGYGVLKRLGSTPLGRPRLLGAKIATVVLVEILQAGVLIGVGFALGWNPGGHGSGVAAFGAVGAALLATVAFGGIGLFMAGVLKAEVNLAAANGLYLVLLLLGGMVVPHLQAARGCGGCGQAAAGRGALGRSPRHPRYGVPGADTVLGGVGGLGRGGSARRRPQLSLGMSFFSSAVNVAGESGPGTMALMVPSPFTNTA